MRWMRPGLRQMIDALDAIHVAGGDRMHHGHRLGLPSRSKRSPIAFSIWSGQHSPELEFTVMTAPSGMRRAASAAVTMRAMTGLDLSRKFRQVTI